MVLNLWKLSMSMLRHYNQLFIMSHFESIYLSLQNSALLSKVSLGSRESN